MKILENSIKIVLIILFTYILTLLFFFDGIYYIVKVPMLLPNIFAIIFILLIFLIILKKKDKKELTNKQFIKRIVLISVIVFLIQNFIAYFCHFTTGWDAGLIMRNVFHFKEKGFLLDPEYFTRYPNNIFMQFIYIVIAKLDFTNHTTTVLQLFNILLVNLTGAFTCLTVNNITKNKRLALNTYLITTPLILLSPWILVMYTDTFASIFPIFIMYLYTKDKKGYLNYFLILILSLIGYMIKPTVIITLLAIIMIELITKNIKLIKEFNLKQTLIKTLIVILSVSIMFGLKTTSTYLLHFKPVKGVYEFNMTQYLVIGQSDKSDGVFNDKDLEHGMKYGMKDNMEIFKKRLTSRTPLEQLQFFSRKTLVNFNSGSFCWSIEGSFYETVLPSSSKMMSTMRHIFYRPGKYNKYLLQFEQYLWLLVLVFVPFIIKKKNNNKELVIITSIIGITLFLTIFEARTRYLYCYAPIFVVSATLGIYNLKNKLKGKNMKLTKNKNLNTKDKMINSYDFDETIYDGDSSVDFYFYSLKRNKKVLLNLPVQAFGSILYALHIVDKTRFKEYVFSFLKRIDNVDDYIKDFWKSHEKNIKDWYYKQKEDTDVIISASPEFLLKPLEKKLNVKIIATKVDKKTGKFISKNCHDHEKIKRYESETKNKNNIKCFYSDSIKSDYPMFNYAETAYLVVKNDIIKLDKE